MGRPPLAIVGLLDQQFLISFSLVKNTNEGRDYGQEHQRRQGERHATRILFQTRIVRHEMVISPKSHCFRTLRADIKPPDRDE